LNGCLVKVSGAIVVGFEGEVIEFSVEFGELVFGVVKLLCFSALLPRVLNERFTVSSTLAFLNKFK
jgi:hypothetical protein